MDHVVAEVESANTTDELLKCGGPVLLIVHFISFLPSLTSTRSQRFCRVLAATGSSSSPLQPTFPGDALIRTAREAAAATGRCWRSGMALASRGQSQGALPRHADWGISSTFLVKLAGPRPHLFSLTHSPLSLPPSLPLLSSSDSEFCES